MNAINRLVISIQLLALATAATLLILFVVGLVPADLIPGAPWLQSQLERIPGLQPLERLHVVLVALGVTTLSLILLIFELFPSPVFDRLRIAQRRGESLTIDRGSVQRLAERTGMEIDGVRSFKVSVKPTRRGVRLRCKALVKPGAPLVDLGEALQRTLNERVSDVAGLKVVRTDIRMRFDDKNPEPPARAEPMRRSEPAPAKEAEATPPSAPEGRPDEARAVDGELS